MNEFQLGVQSAIKFCITYYIATVYNVNGYIKDKVENVS